MGVFFYSKKLVIIFTETTRQDSHVLSRTANSGHTPTPTVPPHEKKRSWLGMISKPFSLAGDTHDVQLLLERCVYINCYMYPCSACCRGGVCSYDSAATAAYNHNIL